MSPRRPQQEAEDSSAAAVPVPWGRQRGRGVQPAPSSLEARSLPGSTMGRMEVFRETRDGWALFKGEEGGRVQQPAVPAPSSLEARSLPGSTQWENVAASVADP